MGAASKNDMSLCGWSTTHEGRTVAGRTPSRFLKCPRRVN